MNSSSSSSSKAWIYDVFLSFRGEDTRKKFTDHLYTALKNAGISTFRDENQLRRGEDISSELSKAIEKSRISIIVLSKNYAASRWCLEEVVKVMECRSTIRGQRVVPIFYDVDPSDVRLQQGSFGDAFAMHEQRFASKIGKAKAKAKVDSWRLALSQVANLSGWDFRNVAHGNEAKFIKKIVGEILRELNNTCLFVTMYPVGIDSHLQEMDLLLNVGLNDVCLVGICGMGGIGKTTIAKAIYNKLLYSFEERCFLANVREISGQPNGHIKLQEQLLADILKTSKVKISSVDRGITMIRERLCNKRVLLVLDDVDYLDQINAITGNHDWFGLGSRIIITTRDEHLLKVLRVEKTYMVKEMNDTESLELFSWHAFRRNHPVEEYEEFSTQIVAYCGGLPLALEVLGSFLFGRSKIDWKSALEKLKRIPHHQIQKKLRISFDALSDDKEKDIFLDVSCFFIGMDKDWTAKILNGCNFFAEIGLSVLIQRCLVTVNMSNKLMMHDMLRDMGRQIVREQYPNEPGKHSRLWVHEEIVDTLTRNMGTEAIEGMTLQLPKRNDVNVDANMFCRMQKLRLLQLNYLQLNGGCEYHLKELRWLCWHGFPLKFVPDSFYQRNLIAIDIRYSNLRQICKNSKFLGKLKFLNLSHSHFLIQTPDFSKLPHLEELKLKDCRSLVEVHPSIGFLDKLVLANFKDCTQLKSIPRMFWKLKSLEILNLSGCSKFAELPDDLGGMESLTTLRADNTAINQLPSTIVRLKKLKDLSVCGCRGSPFTSFLSRFWFLISQRTPSVKLLPTSLQGLNCLKALKLDDCNLSDDAIPEDLDGLSSLMMLNLKGNNFCGLPSSVSGLRKLMRLELNNCTKLQRIPNLPRNLGILLARNCTSLESLPDLSKPLLMHTVDFANCYKLVKLPGLDKLKSVAHVDLARCYKIANSLKESILKQCLTGIILPGSEIPGWFNYNNEGASTSFELPLFDEDEGRLVGLNLCIVFSHLDIIDFGLMMVKITLTNYTTKSCIEIWKHGLSLESSEDHLWLVHLSTEDFKKYGKIKDFEMRSKDLLEVAVQFCCTATVIVKKIGVYLVNQNDENYSQFVDGKITNETSRPKKRAIVISNDEELEKDETRIRPKRGHDNCNGAGTSCDEEPESKRLREMDTDYVVLEGFDGGNFIRWQNNLRFLLSSFDILYVLYTPRPNEHEEETITEIQARQKWDVDDLACRSGILEGISEALFDTFNNIGTAKELWEKLEAHYMAENATNSKFGVG